MLAYVSLTLQSLHEPHFQQPAANQNQNLKPEMKDRDGDVAMEIAAPVVTENMDAEQIRAEKKKFFEALKKGVWQRKPAALSPTFQHVKGDLHSFLLFSFLD